MKAVWNGLCRIIAKPEPTGEEKTACALPDGGMKGMVHSPMLASKLPLLSSKPVV